MIEPGHRVDKYETQRRLTTAAGARSTSRTIRSAGVWVAINRFLDDLGAPDTRERFMPEARSAARLNYPTSSSTLSREPRQVGNNLLSV
jgi:hypothetical protein